MAASNGNGTPKEGSLRERILASKDLRTELVEVPEWGVTVEVRSMSGRDRAKTMERYLRDDGSLDTERLYPELIIATCYDPDSGDPLFVDGDQDALNDKNSGALERLGSAAVKLSGLGPQATDEAGKGSSKTANTASTSS